VVVAVFGASGEARAQFGYGYYPFGYGGYGWGGWGGGSTVQGDIASGLGVYATGLGTLEVDDAVAGSINTDTVIRWNQYMYLSQLQANRNERLRLARREARDAGTSDAIAKRVRENPTDADIVNGDALNAALDQLSDPKVHSSALRLATAKIPAKLVRALPFVNASEAVTISLDQLTAENGWPAELRDPKFAEDRKAYSEAVDKALKEDSDGEVSPETIQQMRGALGRIRAKLDAVPPADRARYAEATNYLKTLYGMTGLLEKPRYEKIIAELDAIKETTLGSLLGFMHTFNLRFGRPTTPEQRAAYEQLYPLIAAHRDRVYREAGVSPKSEDKDKEKDTSNTPPPPPAADRPTDFFRGMRLDHLEGKKRPQGDASK
jgi:hypothetical protein